ncbi:MAG: NifU family protein [Armatimonadetes bacterium]|nr:NifU family protein [Armatimonadota bacterium]
MEMKEKVQEVIDEIRPHLQADGGDIELVDVTEENEVQVRLQGRCRGCPMSQLTMAMVIERTIKERIPEVTGVVPV